LSASTARVIVALVIVSLWVVAVIVAALDGSTMLRATTPFLTMMFGWLFAAKATG
jgi:hypothetical protein